MINLNIQFVNILLKQKMFTKKMGQNEKINSQTK